MYEIGQCMKHIGNTKKRNGFKTVKLKQLFMVLLIVQFNSQYLAQMNNRKIVDLQKRFIFSEYLQMQNKEPTDKKKKEQQK